MQTVSFYLKCLFWKDSGNLFSKCQYSLGFGLKLEMPVEETEDLRLCLGVLVHAVESFLVLLPTVNIGVNQNNEALNHPPLCSIWSSNTFISNTASPETLCMVLPRLRNQRWWASFPLMHFQRVLACIILHMCSQTVHKGFL